MVAMRPHHEILKERSDERHRQNCAVIPGGEAAVKQMAEDIWPLCLFHHSLGPVRRQIGNISGVTFSRFVHKGVAAKFRRMASNRTMVAVGSLDTFLNLPHHSRLPTGRISVQVPNPDGPALPQLPALKASYF